MEAGRWVEVGPSQFSHEAEGLRLIRELLPDVEPFRAWSNFEFRDTRGRWHEVDLVVLGRDTLYLVELKYYSGTLRGDDHTWLRDGNPAEDSPLKLAHRKAQYFATLLKERLRDHWREHGQRGGDVRDYIPYVREVVFLHHPNLRCALPSYARAGLYGLADNTAGLPPVADLLLAPATQNPVSQHKSELLAGLMRKIGLAPKRQREVGSWVIDDEPLDEGELDGHAWQDWPAFHRVATTERYRIRFHIAPPGSSSADELRLTRRIEHEHRMLSRLRHDGVLVPRDIIKDELGVGLVYTDDRRLQRLDLWLADQADGLPLPAQLDIVRQAAEAVHYSHRRRVVHRGLVPSAIGIRERGDGGLAVLVADWDAAGKVPAGTSSLASSYLVSHGAAGSIVDGGELAGGEMFEAPEGRWARDADRIKIDVFALGALAFHVLTNQVTPAQDRGAFIERLRRDGGLDLAVELPQVSSALRELVLRATNPKPSARTPNVAEFLRQLDLATQPAEPVDESTMDPLEAVPGTLLAGRYEYQRRLGSGSTAIGLLVKDTASGKGRVLKVAKDDAAGIRLAAEAEVLGRLDHDRIVDLIEPTEIGGRMVLVLSHAGESTLADELAAKRGRLSLDQLERWGTDLLDALVALDRAGTYHRDIKPANLGVTGKHESRLMLFDFSMAGASPTALTAGTPQYRDPFLGQQGRVTYDSAAERYGAAVVLYEMATGALPVYGDDPDADPASVSDEVTLPGDAFDQNVAEDLARFFAAALSRDAAKRQDTAEDMRRDWLAIFRRLGQVAGAEQPDVMLDTPIQATGLSPRAVSALESNGVATVADLVTLDVTLLNRLVEKEAKDTRKEIRGRVKEWCTRFAGQRVASRPAEPTTMRDPLALADFLVETATKPRSPTRQSAAELILGLRDGLDAFASQQELASAVGRSAPRGRQLIKELQAKWSMFPEVMEQLDQLVRVVTTSLDVLGGVATVRTLTAEILAALPDVSTSEQASVTRVTRVAAGLLRVTLDRYAEQEDAELERRLAKRRHGGRLALLATDPVLLDAADAAGELATALVAAATKSGEPVVPLQRAARLVRERFTEVFTAASTDEYPPAITDLRLVRLAAQASGEVGLSARGELYPTNLAAATAVRLALAGVATTELTPDELISRVRARFPDLTTLPARPALDAIVHEAGLGLRFADGKYTSAAHAPGSTSGLPTRSATVVPETSVVALSRGDHMDRMLVESIRVRSFLVLGVDVVRADEVDKAVALLADRFSGRHLDVTSLLIKEMKTVAEQANLPWDVVRAADAAAAGSRDALGLHALVERVLPRLTEIIDDAVFAPGDSSPVIMTELSPLARYGHLGVVARWSDLAAKRARPAWVVLPQLPRYRGGPVVDGQPMQLGSNGQFVAMDTNWLARAQG